MVFVVRSLCSGLDLDCGNVKKFSWSEDKVREGKICMKSNEAES